MFPRPNPLDPSSRHGRALAGRVLVALALAAVMGPPALAHAAGPPAVKGAVAEDLLRRMLRASDTAAARPAVRPAAPAPSAPFALRNPFGELRTALPTLHAARTSRATGAARSLRSFTSTTSGASVTGGKLPGTLGITGDNFGQSVTTAGDMFGDGLSDVAVGAPYAAGAAGHPGSVSFYYGTPTYSTPPTILHGEQDLEAFGYSVAGVGDVNGDGYPDLLVGAPTYSSGPNTYAGRARLYLGSAFGIQTVPAWTFTTDEAFANVGMSVAWAGDVNNDGYDDWIVGAPGHTNGEANEGAAYLFLGGPAALSTTPAWTFEPNVVEAGVGWSVSTAGDVNGDGHADILVGASNESDAYMQEGAVYLFLGHNTKPSLVPDRVWKGGQAQAYLGSSVAAAGDANGDGYGDFIMGAPYFDDGEADEGEVLIVFGGPLPATYASPEAIESNQAGAHFGWSVGTAGDVNGDGYADVIVGAPGITFSTNWGEAFIYVGSPYGVVPFYYDSITSPTDGETAGVSVGTMGDYYGRDGFSECWTGAPGGVNNGDAWATFGQNFWPGLSENVVAQGYNAGGEFGHAVAGADVNGDGYDDLIVGSDIGGNYAPYDGIACVYYGGPNAFPALGAFPLEGAAPDWTYEGDASDYFGFTLQNAGDVNGDGYQDFVGGGPFHSNTQSLEGEALLFYGSPSGPVGGAPWKVEGTQPAALGGYSVGGGGDLNGDGYDDVTVGFPQGDVGTTYEGLVKVYYGSGFGLSHTPAIVLHSNQVNGYLGTACPIVGDINGDGYDDLVTGAMGYTEGETAEGHAFVHFGSPTGVHSTPDQALQIDVASAGFGWSIYRIGDVNGDGYADVAVSAPNLSDPDTNEGELLVYLGSPGGLQTPAAWTLEGDLAFDNLGETGISGADVNADGFSDLVVGEPFSNYGGATDAGRLRVFLGGPSGLDLAPSLDESSSTVNDNLGWATGGRADFDGDGFPDLAFTQPGVFLVSADEGAALVRFGNSIWFGVRNPPRPLATWRADDSAPVAPGLRSDSPTAFRLKGGARSAAGRTKLRLESEVKPLAAAFDFSGLNRSPWQATGAVAPNLGSSVPLDVPITGLASATRYHWRSRFATRSLLVPYSPWISTEQRNPTEHHVSTAGAPLAVGVDPTPGAVAELALAPAWPNPCRDRATLGFTLPKDGAARLALYDLRGRLVRTVFDGPARAGRTSVSWDGLDSAGRRAAAGAYFLRLSALGEERVGKLVHLP